MELFFWVGLYLVCLEFDVTRPNFWMVESEIEIDICIVLFIYRVRMHEINTSCVEINNNKNKKKHKIKFLVTKCLVAKKTK